MTTKRMHTVKPTDRGPEPDVAPTPVTSEEFRSVIGSFASGVTVVTTTHDGRDFGTTVSAVTSVSLEPPMLLVCVNHTSETGRAISRSGHFAVNILAADQGELAGHFARKGDEKFRDIPFAVGLRGAPLLGGVLSTIECRVVEEVTGGTHAVYISTVERVASTSAAPLTFYRGRLGRLMEDLAQSG
jgi:flavin reductase (DIM6/NTAB) family NADH-FMN oxidoreductase RutF